MGYVFISYSSKNRDSADSVKNLLYKNNIDTWMAPHDIPVGSKYASVIGKSIKNCSCFLLLLTLDSQGSIWVAKEVERAINYKKTIIPIQLEDVILNDEFEMYISTDQILAIKQIDDTTSETQALIATLKAHTNTQVKAITRDVKKNGTLQQLQIGTIIDGKYRIIEKLGQGGYCEVFLVCNEKTNKHWAMKAISKSSERYTEFMHNLSTEIFLLNNLKHPGIPSVIDIIDTSKYLLVVMDYIEGVSLSKVIEENGAQSEEIVLRWAKQLTEAVSYLHSQTPAIIHNDLKPGNIMLKPDGNIMLIDFGTAKKLEDGLNDTVCLGTRFFAAPEVFGSGKVDQRTDIYSIGVTLYSIITGNDPSTPPYMVYPIRRVNPDLSRGFEYIISKCMELHPDNRYQSTDELMNDLQNIDKITHKLNRPTLFKKICSIFKK